MTGRLFVKTSVEADVSFFVQGGKCRPSYGSASRRSEGFVDELPTRREAYSRSGCYILVPFQLIFTG